LPILKEGIAIGRRMPAILPLLEEIYPERTLHGENGQANEPNVTTMWERRVAQPEREFDGRRPSAYSVAAASRADAIAGHTRLR